MLCVYHILFNALSVYCHINLILFIVQRTFNSLFIEHTNKILASFLHLANFKHISGSSMNINYFYIWHSFLVNYCQLAKGMSKFSQINFNFNK